MPQDLHGLPPGAEVWLVNGVTRYVVYYVPETEPPVPLAWEIPSSDDVIALGVRGQDRQITRQAFRDSGALGMGTTDEIPNFGPGVHPFDQLVQVYETESQVKPWLKDPEIMAVWAGAAM